MKDQGVTFSHAVTEQFNRDVVRFTREFGEKKFDTRLRGAVNRNTLREARGILSAKTQGTGDLANPGLGVVREKGAEHSFLLGGRRGRKYKHGYIAHWVELGTSGIVRDAGNKFKKGQRISRPRPGLNFLRDSAERTKGDVFNALKKNMDKAFRNLGK